jgi:hypothetical protein
MIPEIMRSIIFLVALAVAMLLAENGRSQFSPYSPTKAAIEATPRGGAANQLPQTYSNYYFKQLERYHRPSSSPTDYTVDRMYLKNPTVSPYLNLTRRPNSSSGVNNYYRYVRPELERRQTLDFDPRRTSSSTTPRNYYNQFYGGR